jgi:hypothetical protein
MRNDSDKRCKENQNTFYIQKLFFSKILPTIRKCGIRLYSQAGHMRISCWVLKSADTHLDYVTRIGFPLQQWLHESVSMLRHTYISSLVSVMLFMRTAK